MAECVTPPRPVPFIAGIERIAVQLAAVGSNTYARAVGVQQPFVESKPPKEYSLPPTMARCASALPNGCDGAELQSTCVNVAP